MSPCPDSDNPQKNIFTSCSPTNSPKAAMLTPLQDVPTSTIVSGLRSEYSNPPFDRLSLGPVSSALSDAPEIQPSPLSVPKILHQGEGMRPKLWEASWGWADANLSHGHQLSIASSGVRVTRTPRRHSHLLITAGRDTMYRNFWTVHAFAMMSYSLRYFSTTRTL